MNTTTLNAAASWNDKTQSQSNVARHESKLAAFINNQKKNETAWFLISMMVQGIFFLPIPAVLIFDFNAPAYVLIFTLVFFFANIIAGMSGAGVKAIIYLFGASIITHVLLLAIFAL